MRAWHIPKYRNWTQYSRTLQHDDITMTPGSRYQRVICRVSLLILLDGLLTSPQSLASINHTSPARHSLGMCRIVSPTTVTCMVTTPALGYRHQSCAHRAAHVQPLRARLVAMSQIRLNDIHTFSTEYTRRWTLRRRRTAFIVTPPRRYTPHYKPANFLVSCPLVHSATSCRRS